MLHSSRHSPHDLIVLFADLFAGCDNTRLVRGAREPLYLPAGRGEPYAQVIFAHGFFASALHEVAHWCIAGAERRRLEDYGYWYKPDGRSPGEQAEFEVVEVKPQALEWIFSVASGSTFHFSADNLGAGGRQTTGAWALFQKRVVAQVQAYLTYGLPPRGARFAEALSARYGTGNIWRDLVAYIAREAAAEASEASEGPEASGVRPVRS